MGKEAEIKRLLRQIVGEMGRASFLAEVVSVTSDVCSVKVGDLTLTDVRLRALADGSDNHLIITPAIGSIVRISDLSMGDMRELYVSGYSDIDSIVVDGGTFGGLIKIGALVERLNAIETTLNGLLNEYKGHVHLNGNQGAPTGVITPGSTVSDAGTTQRGPLENTKVKH